MSSLLHGLASIGLATACVDRSDHDPPLGFKQVTKLVSGPLVHHGQGVHDRTHDRDVNGLLDLNVIEGEYNVIRFAHPPTADALFEGEQLAGFCFVFRFHHKAVGLYREHFYTCTGKQVVGLHQLVVVPLQQELLDVAEAVPQLLLRLHHEHVAGLTHLLKAPALNRTQAFDAVVKAQGAFVVHHTMVLNLLYAVHHAAVLGLEVVALGQVLKQVAGGASVHALLKQANVDVGNELLDVHVNLSIPTDGEGVKLLNKTLVVNFLDEGRLLKSLRNNAGF